MPRRAQGAGGAPAVVDRAPDGTLLYAPRGEPPRDVDGSAVQCHLCGRWYRDLGASHVRHAHARGGRLPAARRVANEASAAGARVVGRPQRTAARRIPTDARVQAGMAVGAELARSGELQRLADQALDERPAALERQQQLAASGSRLGFVRAAAFSARRDERARSLGFTGLEGFYRRRYRDQRARLDELVAELGCAESAVRGDLRRYGLGPDRARSHGARWQKTSD